MVKPFDERSCGSDRNIWCYWVWVHQSSIVSVVMGSQCHTNQLVFIKSIPGHHPMYYYLHKKLMVIKKLKREIQLRNYAILTNIDQQILKKNPAMLGAGESVGIVAHTWDDQINQSPIAFCHVLHIFPLQCWCEERTPWSQVLHLENKINWFLDYFIMISSTYRYVTGFQ